LNDFKGFFADGTLTDFVDQIFVATKQNKTKQKQKQKLN
jgi:hypothetical protein